MNGKNIRSKQGNMIWCEYTLQEQTTLIIEGGPGLAGYTKGLVDLCMPFTGVVSFHQRGTGLSSKVESFEISEHCDDITGIINHLNLEKVNIIGHSWGANLGLAYALSNSDRVSSLVYMSGTGIGKAWKDDFESERKRLLGSNYDHYLGLKEQIKAGASLGDEAQKAFERYNTIMDYSDPEAFNPSFRSPYKVNQIANKNGFESWYHLTETKEFRTNLENLNTKVTFVHGHNDTRLQIHAYKLLDILGSGAFFSISDAGHYPWIENPNELRTAIHFALINGER